MRKEQDITLGLLSAPHLGDTLCTSVLPRQIYETYGFKPYVVRHETTEAVFGNNPYVAGFGKKRICRLNRHISGQGHMIQRLQQGFNLEASEIPKPEIYLSDDEIAWAESEKSQWPADKPVCIVSLRAISDGALYADVDWRMWLVLLNECFTVIKPIMSKPRPYYGSNCGFDSKYDLRNHTGDDIFYENLPVRRFFALFNVADCCCSVTSGASHLAAAFSLPTMIFMRNDILDKTKKVATIPPLTPASFLYPQHTLTGVFAKCSIAEKIVEEFYREVELSRLNNLSDSIENNRESVIFG